MTLLDGLIVVAYLSGIVAVGIICRGRQEDIRDYFTAQQGFSGFLGMVLVGLSIAATLFSGLSFVSYPSVVYQHGVTVLSLLLGFPALYLFLRFWFFPRYLAQPQNSPYDIIERRFGRSPRLAMSGMFVCLRLFWMAALIYAPVLVVMAACSLDTRWFWPLVLVIGLSSTFYTVVGGIRGVIVTDAIQMLLIIAVLAGIIGFIFANIPISVGEVWGHLRENSRLVHLNWSLDPTVTITVWAMAIGGTMQNLSSFTADQMSLQRYLAAGSVGAASRAFGTSMISTLVVLVLLATVGLTLGAWYHLHPDPALPSNPDKVLPHFVATSLPVGFMGMVMAAILAATMSSVTSGVNALSGSLLNDFVPLAKRIEPRRLLRIARWTSAGVGELATVAAGFVHRLGTIFDIMNIFFGVFLGPLLGGMFCAVSRLRVDGRALIVGLASGCMAGAAVAYSPVTNLWVTLASSAVTVLVTWTGSRLLSR
jgi:Na+/proline symporter